MLEHYSYIRQEPKKRALDGLSTGGHVTKNVPKENVSEEAHPQVIENAGGDDGTRTRDLMRDRHAGLFHSVHPLPYFPYLYTNSGHLPSLDDLK